MGGQSSEHYGRPGVAERDRRWRCWLGCERQVSDLEVLRYIMQEH